MQSCDGCHRRSSRDSLHAKTQTHRCEDPRNPAQLAAGDASLSMLRSASEHRNIITVMQATGPYCVPFGSRVATCFDEPELRNTVL